jgi:uncharacterized protein with GYD domain
LEKSQQKFIAFIKIGSAGSGKLYDEIMKWKEKPMGGVKLHEAYQVFGKWDFAVLFEADSNENALHFVGDIVRPIEGVVAMRTIPVAPLRSWR